MTNKATITENEDMSNGSLTAITLELLKQSNPRIGAILTELKSIQNGLWTLHDYKATHRKSVYFFGTHCEQCKIWSQAQNYLRYQRKQLFEELRKLSYGMDPLELLKLEQEEEARDRK